MAPAPDICPDGFAGFVKLGPYAAGDEMRRGGKTHGTDADDGNRKVARRAHARSFTGLRVAFGGRPDAPSVRTPRQQFSVR